MRFRVIALTFGVRMQAESVGVQTLPLVVDGKFTTAEHFAEERFGNLIMPAWTFPGAGSDGKWCRCWRREEAAVGYADG